MYSILLIDDEKSIREYLPKVIPFQEYGFIIRDTAMNGEQGLKKIPIVCPDLILLDVRMPKMDGLQFLKQLRQSQYTDTFVIMLSGCNDFECIKEAMKYGVKDYLTKPIDEDELIPLLDKMRVELDNLHNEKELSIIREQMKLLNKLYNGGVVERKQFNNYSFMTCVIFPCSYKLENTNPHLVLQECLSKHIGEIGSCQFKVKGSRYTFLIPNKLFLKYGAGKKEFADKLIAEMKKEHIDCAFIFDSYVFENTDKSFREDFSNHYYEMLTLLFYSPKEYIDYSPEKLEINCESNIETIYLDEIRQYIATMDKKEILKSTERLVEKIKEMQLGIQYVQEINYRIYYLILTEISEVTKSIQTETFFTKPDWIDYPYFVSFKQWNNIIYSLIMEGVELIKSSCRLVNVGISKEVIEYIHSHYMDQISLKQIAEMFYVNAAYLGRAFQKATGVNFKQYLNRIRIAEAKKLLLKTDKLIYEIANEVGYTESKYFIVKFSQEVGKSPTEYRNQM